jgi:hypothetical protein
MSNQEDEIYNALNEGDWETIYRLRDESDEDSEHVQFKIDYNNAYAHYQSDHEMPEEDRVELTAEKVEEENEIAPEVIEEEVVEE